jgi:hypothetical protein
MEYNADALNDGRRWAPPRVHLTNLGPHPIELITPAVRGHLVQKMGVPVIISDGLDSYAVLAPANRNLKVLCAGCFTPGCSLGNDLKCRKVSSHCQHLTTQRQAKFPCVTLTTKDGLSAVHDRNEEAGVTDADFLPIEDANMDFGNISTVDLIQELRRREELDNVLNYVDTDVLAQKAKDIGIKLLFDARPDDLRHELRRVTDGARPTVEDYYWKDKVSGVPHCTDRLDPYETRSKRARLD